ncbi:MAG: hypothetical protein JNJ40_10395 [Bacteroidia bacterium]|nr:hypothetical protein [Bacteroidia bacterium]
MRRIISFLTLMLLTIATYACPECEKQQPKILRGIAHGAGPESQWDYVIVWAIVAIVVVTLFFAVKWTIKPGEKDPNHIKRTLYKF